MSIPSSRITIPHHIISTTTVLCSCCDRVSNIFSEIQVVRMDAGRDGRTRRARPKSQARTGSEEHDWQAYSVDPYSSKCDDDICTYIPGTYIATGWRGALEGETAILYYWYSLCTQHRSNRIINQSCRQETIALFSKQCYYTSTK